VIVEDVTDYPSYAVCPDAETVLRPLQGFSEISRTEMLQSPEQASTRGLSPPPTSRMLADFGN
jgi:hypothetical protein